MIVIFIPTINPPITLGNKRYVTVLFNHTFFLLKSILPTLTCLIPRKPILAPTFSTMVRLAEFRYSSILWTFSTTARLYHGANIHCECHTHQGDSQRFNLQLLTAILPWKIQTPVRWNIEPHFLSKCTKTLACPICIEWKNEFMLQIIQKCRLEISTLRSRKISMRRRG